MSKCAETAGFLISAPCRHQATGKCMSCGKPICERHQRKVAAPGVAPKCITCYRKSEARFTEDHDDPYLYTGSLYPDYYQSTHYREDWAGAEAVLLAQEYDSERWEGDFEGS